MSQGISIISRGLTLGPHVIWPRAHSDSAETSKTCSRSVHRDGEIIISICVVTSVTAARGSTGSLQEQSCRCNRYASPRRYRTEVVRVASKKNLFPTEYLDNLLENCVYR